MNVVEWLVYAAALQLQRSADDDWLRLEMKVRWSCRWVTTEGHRRTTPYPDLSQLIEALKV